MDKKEAFRQMVDQYKDKVVNTCFGFVHQREDAEDIAQDVFVEAWIKYDTFKGDAQLSTWLYRIAVNKSIDALRKQKARKYIDLFKNILHLDSKESMAVKQNQPDPHQKMELDEREQILVSALQNIALNQRIAITLSKYEDLSVKEIAQVMETTESAVESLLSRAKLSLRKQLEATYKNI